MLGGACLGSACIGGYQGDAIADVGPGTAGAGAGAPHPGDPFGYGQAFADALKQIGQISPAELVARHPAPSYLKALGFDPARARFFDDFQKVPNLALAGAELTAFKRNGFVVSERQGAASFAELYYRVFTHDLPVFITADSLLHAWHRSYDAILEELEETYLYHSVDAMLAGMHGALPAARKAYGGGVLASSVIDADYFISVARSLLAGSAQSPKLGSNRPRITRTLAAIAGERLQSFNLFGRARKVDYSQFKVRGHYENSPTLKKYFRAMMWLGRIDLRLAGDAGDDYSRQLGSALVLHDLLARSGGFASWSKMDRLLQTFVGRTDSMTFAQLGDVLKAGGIAAPADVRDLDALKTLSAKIGRGRIGAQAIRSAYFESSPLGSDKASLPFSFTVMGQKFTVDSWVTGKIVADDITWDGAKVQRRMPSALDVAYSVLANDQVGPLIHDRIVDRSGRPFRDGLPYQHNLAATRAVMDSHAPKAWQENLYMGWLALLRQLSTPTSDASYPAAMRTEAWAMKTLNTQLASWSQLRHDTILYVKQSYTASVTCFYPAGYVEPRPAFWNSFTAMARQAAALLSATPYPSGAGGKAQQQRHVTFFGNFADKLALLASIAGKQRAKKTLTAVEDKVLEDVVQISHGSGATYYSGWYPTLFYKGAEDCGKYDALVADVHTDVPAPPLGDPGGVLHQGVGQIDMLMITVDCDGDRMTYAGPTFSHYEYATRGVTRHSDSDWKKHLTEGKAPARPKWTDDYLVSGANPRAKYYDRD